MEGREARLGALETHMDRFETALLAVDQRLDRLFLALVAGLIGVVGTLFVAFFAI